MADRGALAGESYPDRPITALLLLEMVDPEGIDTQQLEAGDPIDEGVADMVAHDAAEVVENHYRVKATVVDRLSTFSLGELQLLHLGLAVIGDQCRVDHRLTDEWSQLLEDVGRAATTKARNG